MSDENTPLVFDLEMTSSPERYIENLSRPDAPLKFRIGDEVRTRRHNQEGLEPDAGWSIEALQGVMIEGSNLVAGARLRKKQDEDPEHDLIKVVPLTNLDEDNSEYLPFTISEVGDLTTLRMFLGNVDKVSSDSGEYRTDQLVQMFDAFMKSDPKNAALLPRAGGIRRAAVRLLNGESRLG